MKGGMRYGSTDELGGDAVENPMPTHDLHATILHQLGLDSIDILEVALEVSNRYGFQLRSDDADNEHIFRNLRSLAAHVAAHRTK